MIETDRIVGGQALEEDMYVQPSVRPQMITDYIGQQAVREQLQLSIHAAKMRNEHLDHVLLYGPPGWVKPRFPISSPRKWASPYARHPDQSLKTGRFGRHLDALGTERRSVCR